MRRARRPLRIPTCGSRRRPRRERSKSSIESTKTTPARFRSSRRARTARLPRSLSRGTATSSRSTTYRSSSSACSWLSSGPPCWRSTIGIVCKRPSGRPFANASSLAEPPAQMQRRPSWARPPTLSGTKISKAASRPCPLPRWAGGQGRMRLPPSAAGLQTPGRPRLRARRQPAATPMRRLPRLWPPTT